MSNKKKRIMIVGAGWSGQMLARNYQNSDKYEVVCAVDDNDELNGKKLDNYVPIVGNRNDILTKVMQYKIDNIIIALPSIKGKDKKEIWKICSDTKCRVISVPEMFEIDELEYDISRLRNIKIEDLLGRKPIIINNKLTNSYIRNAVILITGAGGSIGSELSRQIVMNSPKKIILLDIYENGVYDLQQELKFKFPNLNIEVLIASVRNEKRIRKIVKKYRPDIIFHAAAHKHVPLMEKSPNEAIKNNVFGTYNVAKAAMDYCIGKFILISTDKAVNPTNIMGASKRICEMIIQMFDKRTRKTDFAAVRFGNVLGSNGSVVPLFKKQILEGGPVTVTDPNIIRYFMTIPEAVSLVLQAGGYARGGEIFVLDMGEPVKILDLAKNLIRLAGFDEEEIEIKFTGLRPGEKLYEELLMSEEGMRSTDNSLIFIGKPISFDETEFEMKLVELRKSAYADSENIKEKVREIVPSYVING
jgi:putative epimerase/dehydratase wbiI